MNAAEVNDDSGLQPERTTLAWRRTTLTAACVVLLSFRAWLREPATSELVALILGVLVSGVLAAGIRRRTRECGATTEAIRPAHPLLMFLISASLSIGSGSAFVSLL